MVRQGYVVVYIMRFIKADLTGYSICREFARDGKCRFRKCKFSHSISNSSDTDKKDQRDNSNTAGDSLSKEPERTDSEGDSRIPGQAVQKNDKLLPLFNMNQTFPGGRHNNDSADICDIRILPTPEEILSPHPEYLPVKDPEQWHLDGVPGLLDRNFRLLRQDTVGQLRDTIRAVLQPSTNRRKAKTQPRAYADPNVSIAALFFSQRIGLKFVIQFRQLYHVQRMSIKQREEWWELSNRLQGGAFLCLVDARGEVLFCTAAEPPKLTPRNPRPKDWSSLWKDKDIATVALELIDPSGDDVQFILGRYRPRGTVQLTLLEFPGILFPAFGPTLQALQEMKRSGDLPFAEFLAPVSLETCDHSMDVPPPEYALKPGFSFDLSCLMTDKTPLKIRRGQTFDIQKLQDHSALDKTQAVALVNTQQRRIGLIQGPPGTGKSYTGVALIKVLLANGGKDKGNIGPIICVCYTNHALDQLLEELLEKKIAQIVRIGSRSQSEVVSRYTLRKLVRKTKTKSERGELQALNQQVEDYRESFVNLKLHSEGSESDLKQFLQTHDPKHHCQLLDKYDEEAFQKAQRKRGDVFQQWIKAGP
ncbi:uncharacterized protein BO80DRAFT_487165 [Aspergillus ibericus CBS 121593]|uniref:C3H1-type domain-containing protein n=1 Tax=Aspergillus ibericus CBS 121593 TaxID=1448316 RepID=A0A395GJ15_9EURO|nr:hypothetical protein BO80DRAFT_487165 [Aspergillus ibericus CBS 121593]RAK95354.1 hypothetical protein BO80DRAFT_487165 [Aspergillus ibericus CBS 121593]